MKHVSNEQKANEIAENIVGNDHYSYFDDFKLCALQAMEWKDEQHKQERQQLIYNAAEWFRNRFPNMSNEAIEKFKEDMKGE